MCLYYIYIYTFLENLKTFLELFILNLYIYAKKLNLGWIVYGLKLFLKLVYKPLGLKRT